MSARTVDHLRIVVNVTLNSNEEDRDAALERLLGTWTSAAESDGHVAIISEEEHTGGWVEGK